MLPRSPDMTKTTETDLPKRLDMLEAHLLQVEEILRVLICPLPPEFWWLRSLPARSGSPLVPLPAAFFLSREARERRRDMRETPVEPWQYLVSRQHPWRKQLYVKGRNMTARQLVGAIKANGFDEAKASDNFKLPVEAIREALAYVEQNRELLETEAEIERLMLKRGGVARGPQPVS
jgi:hypothetical protein